MSTGGLVQNILFYLCYKRLTTFKVIHPIPCKKLPF